MRTYIVILVLLVIPGLSGCAASGQYANDPNLWLYLADQQNAIWSKQDADARRNIERSQDRYNQIGDTYQKQLNDDYNNQRLIEAINKNK